MTVSLVNAFIVLNAIREPRWRARLMTAASGFCFQKEVYYGNSI
jgi:hypothetical protein